MKRTLVIGLLLLAGSWAHATLSEDFSGGTVNQADPVGVAFTGTFNMANPGDTVAGITVTLNVSGGYSGGFYISLTGPDGSTTVTLLNTPGTTTLGANTLLTFSDTGGTAIPGPGSPLPTGTYTPYQALSGLNNQPANGNWTLYFADLSSGGGSPTLNGWTLDVDVVPEPVNVALGMFAGLAALWWCLGLCWKKAETREGAVEESESLGQ